MGADQTVLSPNGFRLAIILRLAAVKPKRKAIAGTHGPPSSYAPSGGAPMLSGLGRAPSGGFFWDACWGGVRGRPKSSGEPNILKVLPLRMPCPFLHYPQGRPKPIRGHQLPGLSLPYGLMVKTMEPRVPEAEVSKQPGWLVRFYALSCFLPLLA